MPWCVPITWDDPFAAEFSGSPVGGSLNTTAAVIPAGGTTEDLIKEWNDNNAQLGYTFFLENGCICVETEAGLDQPTGIKVGFDPGDPTPTSGNHTANFSEIDKEPVVDPEIQACLDCFEELFGCSLLDLIPETEVPALTKEAIGAAIAAGLGGPGEPTPQTFTATLLGTSTEVPKWDAGDPIPTLGPVVNPSCEGDEFGTLWISLGLPATVQPGPASTTFTVIDASSGWGTTKVVDKSTGTILGQTYPPGAGGQGNNVPVPFDHTINYTIPADADPTQICMVIDAFGNAGAWPGTCDEIGPGETIVTTTPSECAPALACLEELFGCSLAEMVAVSQNNAGEPALATVDDLPRVRVCGCGSVAASGIYDGEDFTVEKTGTGCYEVSFQPPAGGGSNVIPMFTPVTDNLDDLNLSYSEIGTNQYKVVVTEQDNGGAVGDPIDNGFSVLGICCDSAIVEPPIEGVVTEGPVTIDNNTGTVTIVNNTNVAQTYTIEDAAGTQTVTVAANSTQTVTGLTGSITVAAGVIGQTAGGVKALVGIKGVNREAPLEEGPKVGAVISYLPLENKVQIAAINETGEAVKVGVERDPGKDATFSAKGAEGEAVTTVKSYDLEAGVNDIRVTEDNVVIAQRKIDHTVTKKATKG